MSVKATTTAIKAIASLLIERYLFRYALITTVSFIVSWLISVALVLFHSQWWLGLTILLLPLILCTGFIVILSFVALTGLRPRKITRSEAKLIHEFVRKFGIQAIAAKSVKKNPVALSSIVAWKYLKNGGKQPISGIIMEPINDVKSLNIEFQKIVSLFE